MQALLLGLVALVAAIFLSRASTGAQRMQVLKIAAAALGLVLISGAIIATTRGFVWFALPAAVLGLWLLMQRSSPGSGGRWQVPGQGQAADATSRVVTDFLEMELERDTGAMRGRVLKGVFAGRDIERMAPAELALLWQDCRFGDPPSAQLVEAYLDRRHPSWREDMARAEQETGAGGQLTPEEALEILGLKPGASADEIRRAHRELMKRFHPDRGGSAYLAAKINEAKDLLLRSHR